MHSNFRTDMAIEARARNSNVAGVTEQTEKRNGLTVTTIEIETDAAGQKLGKATGTYVTLEAPGIADRSPDAFRNAEEETARELSALLNGIHKRAPLLVVGLGNRMVTADSLGPAVVSKLLVTRHILETMPEIAPMGLPSVAAIAPGVLGVTGVETLEVVRGLIREIRPGAVLCIDALSSLRASRISTSIQLNDSGILPGSGVGNRRNGLNKETLELPVFAVGVPTVVSAHTIVVETVGKMSNTQGDELEALAESLANTMDEMYGELIVTPKDVDRMIADAANILSGAINRALYEDRYGEMQELLS